MSSKSFFFAGGGTGGHIYPAVAIAEQLVKLQSDAKIHFFVSTRNIDAHILSKTNFEYTQLSAKGFSPKPLKMLDFCLSFFKSSRTAKRIIAESKETVVIGIGGFVAAPVCFAAHRLKVPVVLLNTDSVPGKANRLIGRWADEILVQFENTAKYFAKTKAATRSELVESISVVGCPLRSGFANPQPDKAIRQLGLDENKKILLITGASSGSENINTAICSILDKFDAFADNWQIVHLTGLDNLKNVQEKYADVRIKRTVLGYFDDMPNLLAAADLVVGRSGAVSVAEYVTAEVPSICIPYPYHKDRHQYLNAERLVEAGAAVIVDDLPLAFGGVSPKGGYEKGQPERLWRELERLMRDDKKRQQMAEACRLIAKKDAAAKIAEKLLKIRG